MALPLQPNWCGGTFRRDRLHRMANKGAAPMGGGTGATRGSRATAHVVRCLRGVYDRRMDRMHRPVDAGNSDGDPRRKHRSLMITAALIFAGLAALLHVYIFVMESLTWTSARTRATFGTTPEEA